MKMIRQYLTLKKNKQTPLGKKIHFVSISLIFILMISPIGCGKQQNKENKVTEMEEKITKQPISQELTQEPEGPFPIMTFSSVLYDFGTIYEGEEVDHSFSFTNTGNAPLIIQNVNPSCGCTVPEWTKDSVPAGKTGIIKVGFNSSGRVGMNNKSVTVTSNSWPPSTTLHFTVNVVEKKVD